MSEPVKKFTRDEVIAGLRKANEEAKAFREKHPDSPLTSIAFQLSAMCGEIEAAISSEPVPPSET